MNFTKEEREELVDLLKRTAVSDTAEAKTASRELAKAIETPLKDAAVDGSIIEGIFEQQTYDPAQRIEYPVSFYRTDNADEYTAYVMPDRGRIPQRAISGDYVTVPTYRISNAIDYDRRYAREANWNIVGKAMEVLEEGHTAKKNIDGWHTLLRAAVDRNVLVADSNATAGQFTKRLVSLLKLVMKRNAGGNSTSKKQGRLTHLFLSPEAVEDMRSWDIDEIDDITRREIFIAEDGTFQKVFGVTLVDLNELGPGQKFQNYAVDELAASMAASDTQFMIGLDLTNKDSFVNPVRQTLEVFEDMYLHREGRQGWYTEEEVGFAVLDARRILLASC
jgi:hypothetical protein